MKYLSLFSGIEAATVAWHPLGWQPVAFSEVYPFCCELLGQRYPDIPNLGDINEISEQQVRQLGLFDLIVFGSPCQDLSVAGKRQGLNGERSGLFRRAIDIIHWAATHNGCRYALWENVPGVLSSHQGADFSEVLRLFTGSSQGCPKKGWQTSGVAYGSAGIVEWRVLDAQHFGVPQRRRRVFAFLDLGERPHDSPVLFEREGVCRHPEASTQAGKDLAGTLEARTTAGGFPGTDGACANHIVPCFWDGSQTSQCLDAVRAKGQCMPEKNRFPAVLEPLPIHDQATRFAGKRADNQDGKGNGLGVGSPGDPMNTLTSGDQHAVCFQQNQRDEVRLVNGDGQLAGSLPSESGMKNTNYLSSSLCVRRLTPVECERLQGLPDNWTKIPYRNKSADDCPDTPRYRAIGNSMAVPVMRWIGERIACCAKPHLST